MASKKPFLTAVLVFAIAAILIQSCSVVRAQTEVLINPLDVFSIPELNGNINFAVNGTCSRAYYENGAWLFVDIVLGSSNSTEKLDLTVSARNSNLTIASYRRTNSSFAGSPASSTRLRYNVVGIGSQTFNLHLSPKDGDYSVIADGVFLGLFDGWNISSDSTVTISGERRNVTIAFYGVPETHKAFLAQPFLEQHTVILSTLVVLTVTVILTLVIKTRKRRLMKKATLERRSVFSDMNSSDGSLEETEHGI